MAILGQKVLDVRGTWFQRKRLMLPRSRLSFLRFDSTDRNSKSGTRGIPLPSVVNTEFDRESWATLYGGNSAAILSRLVARRGVSRWMLTIEERLFRSLSACTNFFLLLGGEYLEFLCFLFPIDEVREVRVIFSIFMFFFSINEVREARGIFSIFMFFFL